jgi:hypothetical protein
VQTHQLACVGGGGSTRSHRHVLVKGLLNLLHRPGDVLHNCKRRAVRPKGERAKVEGSAVRRTEQLTRGVDLVRFLCSKCRRWGRQAKHRAPRVSRGVDSRAGSPWGNAFFPGRNLDYATQHTHGACSTHEGSAGREHDSLHFLNQLLVVRDDATVQGQPAHTQAHVRGPAPASRPAHASHPAPAHVGGE